MNIVEVKDLTKTYQSGEDTLLILDNLSFTLPLGGMMSLTGESGSGKSTLLNILGALDKGDQGEVTSCGVNLSVASEETMALYRNKKMGFIFQFHYLLRDFNALENVMLPGQILNRDKGELQDQAMALLKAVGLESRWHHYPSQLSGGERQRVALARALINSPELILADEPTGSLDEKNSRVVEELLLSIVKEAGLSMVFVTHNRLFASQAPICYSLRGGAFEVQ